MKKNPHPCEPWAEPISLLAAGCLSPDEERNVRLHIETCSECEKRLCRLTQLCDALEEARMPVNVGENAIVERVMSTIAAEESRRSLPRNPAEIIQPPSLDRWRWIMRSPVSRLAAAAILVLTIGAAMFFQGGGTAYAFADFAASFLDAKTVKFRMTAESKGPPARTITSEVMVEDGSRMRQVTEWDESKMVIIEDLSQGKTLTLDSASKTATVLTSTHLRKDQTHEYGTHASVLFQLFQHVAENKPGIEHTPLGENEIDGHKVLGFRISGPLGDFDLWGDPKTGLPFRLEITMGIGGSVKSTFSDFEFNVEMDESLFSIEPPADYTVRNKQSDGPPSSPEEKDLIEMFRDYSNLWGGAFPDSLDPLTTTTMVTKKALIQVQTQNLWATFAPGKEKPNEEQRHTLEALVRKTMEASLTEDQRKKIIEQVQEFIQTQELKTVEIGADQAQETEEFRQAQINEIMGRVQRGLTFANRLPPSADAHYVGKGVSFGTADTPIFWYRTKDSKTYRVIHADLSVHDSDTPPDLTKGQPAPAQPGV